MREFSVRETVRMYGTRKIGKNVPYSGFTFFPEEAEGWIGPNCEMVNVRITPYIPEVDDIEEMKDAHLDLLVKAAQFLVAFEQKTLASEVLNAACVIQSLRDRCTAAARANYELRKQLQEKKKDDNETGSA